MDAHAAATRMGRSAKRRVFIMFCFPLAAQAEVPGNQGLYSVPYSQYEAFAGVSRCLLQAPLYSFTATV
jgi:hypothetical protein